MEQPRFVGRRSCQRSTRRISVTPGASYGTYFEVLADTGGGGGFDFFGIVFNEYASGSCSGSQTPVNFGTSGSVFEAGATTNSVTVTITRISDFSGAAVVVDNVSVIPL